MTNQIFACILCLSGALEVSDMSSSMVCLMFEVMHCLMGWITCVREFFVLEEQHQEILTSFIIVLHALTSTRFATTIPATAFLHIMFPQQGDRGTASWLGDSKLVPQQFSLHSKFNSKKCWRHIARFRNKLHDLKHETYLTAGHVIDFSAPEKHRMHAKIWLVTF